MKRTSLTAPDLDVHIELVFAKPTVEPSKSTPLGEEELNIFRHQL